MSNRHLIRCPHTFGRIVCIGYVLYKILLLSFLLLQVSFVDCVVNVLNVLTDVY